MGEAAKRGIVVEVTLFGDTHDTTRWIPSPFQGSNNVNGIGATYTNFFTSMFDPPLLHHAEMLVRKTVTELNQFDNVFYQICAGSYLVGEGRTDDWQSYLTDTLVKTEAALPARYMVAWNYADTSTQIASPNPQVSVFSYSRDSTRSRLNRNARFGRAITLQQDVEATSVEERRRRAWSFVLSGGAIYSEVDNSYTPDDPNGIEIRVAGLPGRCRLANP